MSEEDFGNSSMLDMYLFESTSLLNQLDDILLESEENESLTSENINEIFRIMHTIKGSSAMMEFNTISFVSHKLEDLFYIIRDNGIPGELFSDLFDLVLNVSDFLKEEVEKVQLNQPLSEQNEDLVNTILDFIEQLKSTDDSDKAEKTAPVAPVAPAPPAASEDAPAAAVSEAAPCTIVLDDTAVVPEEPTVTESFPVRFLRAKFQEGCQMENIRAVMLMDKIKPLGKILESVPNDLGAEASTKIIEKGFFCSFSGECSDDALLKAALSAPSVASCSLVDGFPAVSEATKAEAEKSKAAAEQPVADGTAHPDSNKHSTKQNLINVDLNKLDTLLDLVGEIVITESMVSSNVDIADLHLENFDKATRQLRKLTNELQDIVMSIRMVPIAATFQKMKRIVRDMSKKLDKDATLVLVGETTEVDKTIIDAIADPIMHLVRNAMDHAIESKEERMAAVKDPTGKIILSAQNVGSDIIIGVSDDGKGLDPDFILNKAKSKGLLSKPESEYSEKEIFNLLTLPGFSTKETVTEFSGRGVGMDVVKKNIEKISGTVTIESKRGSGTTIYFKIPLTLAIIESMEIRAGKNIYTIPITNIRESFKADKKNLLRDPDGREMIMIRGVCYPIIRLHEIFHIENCITDVTEGILLLVDSGDRLACLLADELIGKHQVVVKPLPSYLARFFSKGCGIAGCTVMGDGNISLILDTPGILERH